ncbi:hypothetical protein GGX14DRAFT_700142 [Mycena pura]|uniref:Uncharacterized protein n=1 Tax=Mycena pura TaxID=153505 RepID=A0AAD6UZW5_9AGAR|nr:hypothetical protein GGX14DRAFT_700142 [Mycena pura]
MRSTESRVEFPILEKLTLQLYDPLPVHTTLFLGSLPALTDFTLQCSYVSIPSTLDFIWAQLPGTRVCLQMFSRMTNAQLTSVHTVVSDLSLRCHDSEQRAMHTLLDALTAPCLKKFSITGSFFISRLIAFFDRSSCALTHLNIDHHNNTYDTDLLTLLGTPHACDIVDLGVSLRSLSMPRKLADALATRDIIPNLCTLALKCSHGINGSVDSLLKIYAGRRPVLQSLWLSRASLSQDVEQALKSAGLEVVTFTY